MWQLLKRKKKYFNPYIKNMFRDHKNICFEREFLFREMARTVKAIAGAGEKKRIRWKLRWIYFHDPTIIKRFMLQFHFRMELSSIIFLPSLNVCWFLVLFLSFPSQRCEICFNFFAATLSSRCVPLRHGGWIITKDEIILNFHFYAAFTHIRALA